MRGIELEIAMLLVAFAVGGQPSIPLVWSAQAGCYVEGRRGSAVKVVRGRMKLVPKEEYGVA